jgi:hypothetical protein
MSSNWAVFVNTPIFIFFGLFAYNAYAKRWSAKTGKHSTQGHVTWSGEIPGGKPPYLVSYSYYVDGILYNGQLSIPLFSAEKIIKQNPKGKEIVVYYAKKEPGFSQANKPPSHAQIIGSSLITHLVLPLFLINMIFSYIYWLAHVNS